MCLRAHAEDAQRLELFEELRIFEQQTRDRIVLTCDDIVLLAHVREQLVPIVRPRLGRVLILVNEVGECTRGNMTHVSEMRIDLARSLTRIATLVFETLLEFVAPRELVFEQVTSGNLRLCALIAFAAPTKDVAMSRATGRSTVTSVP